jgi:hypothetical protein
MPPSKSARRKQRLNRRGTSKSTADIQSSETRSTPGAHKLLAGAEQFAADGMRYPPEVLIHNEMYAIKSRIYFRDAFIFHNLIDNRQQKGEVIKYLDESERVDVNPMLINYHRANTIRKYRNLPQLDTLGQSPEIDLMMGGMSLEPAGDTQAEGGNIEGMSYLCNSKWKS